MTTAHRPTFDAARGKDNSSAPTRQYSSRSLPAHKALKYRQTVQSGGGGGESRPADHDLRAELLAAEAAHYEKTRGKAPGSRLDESQKLIGSKAAFTEGTQPSSEGDTTETPEEKKRRILQETEEIDADDSGSEEDGEDDDSSEESDDEDEAAELMRELEKIKAERAAEKARKEAEEAEEEQAKREEEIAFGNPLLNDTADFSLKRRWDEDVVFRVKEKDESGKKDFVNDLLRSDFHRSFMKKYVR